MRLHSRRNTARNTPRNPRRLYVAVAIAALVGAVLAVARPAAASPILEKRIIGYSVQGRPIIAYHLGAFGATPKSLIIGQIHGDEHAGVTLTESILHATRSIEGINLWIVPTMNPDGDAAHTRQNADKVDLNRNFPENWAPLTGKYYSGPYPLSEPESRAMKAFLLWLHPTYTVVLHQPLYAVDGTANSARARVLRDALSRNLGLPLSSLNCWSQCYGSMATWWQAQHSVIDTVEFGWTPTTSYLTGQARDGILHALQGHWGDLSRHNPHSYLGVTPHHGGAHVGGWAYDPDFTSASITYTIRNNGYFYDQYTTSHPSPVVNRRYGITGTHTFSFWLPMRPGTHEVCLVLHNQGAGTGNPRPCRTVHVPA